MKTIPLKYVAAHSLGRNCTMGASYQAKCPFCAHKITVWPNEYQERKLRTDSGNICIHAEKIVTEGLVAREKMNVRAFGNVVRVNGLDTHLSMLRLYNELGAVKDDEYDKYSWPNYPAYAPHYRFDAIWAEVKHMYQSDPERWAAQDAAHQEDKERAELARLLKKYALCP